MTSREPQASELLFDPEALLVREPRVLLDARFLGALHAELEDELGRDAATVTLLQLGFLQGLRDVLLDTKAACGDDSRGVMASINPELSALHAEVYALAKRSVQLLRLGPSAAITAVRGWS